MFKMSAIMWVLYTYKWEIGKIKILLDNCIKVSKIKIKFKWLFFTFVFYTVFYWLLANYTTFYILFWYVLIRNLCFNFIVLNTLVYLMALKIFTYICNHFLTFHSCCLNFIFILIIVPKIHYMPMLIPNFPILLSLTFNLAIPLTFILFLMYILLISKCLNLWCLLTFYNNWRLLQFLCTFLYSIHMCNSKYW